MKHFILSDVHSFYGPMAAALNKKGFDITDKSHKIILCGDLFDRGPAAKDCWNFITKMYEQDRLVYIRGNHETLLAECTADLECGRDVKRHHISNKTVDTISQLSGINCYDLMIGTFKQKKLWSAMAPVNRFIEENAVDYYELDNYVFVHGWVPTVLDKTTNKLVVTDNWKYGDWDEARWVNGIKQWRDGCYVPGKTIVCGHWHCSWGWAHIRNERPELPKKDDPNLVASFEPFIAQGIAAMDSCVVYSGFCNCLVIDEEGKLIV